MRLVRRRSWGMALAFAVLFASSIGADPESSFKKGIAARDLGRYDESADWLRRAIGEKSQESEKQVFISGVFCFLKLN